MASYTPKSPNYKPSWPGMRLGDGQNTLNAVETTTQAPSDHAVKKDHFSGVIRFGRDFRKYLVSNLFGPSINSCDPTIIDPGWGAKIYLMGTNFQSGSMLYVNGRLASSGTLITENRMSFQAPPSLTGEGPITFILIRPDGRTTSAEGLAVYEVAPVLASVYPSGAFTKGGGNDFYVQLEGASFKQGSRVDFASGGMSYSSPSITWRGPNLLDVFPPAVPSTGTYTVQVFSPSALSSSILTGFEYTYAPPFVSELRPPLASTDGGEIVTVVGSDFLSGSVVHLANPSSGEVIYSASFTGSDSVAFTLQTTTSGAGDYSLRVENPDGQFSNAVNLKRVVGLYRVYSAAPTSGVAGETVTLTGTNFSSSITPENNIQNLRFGDTSSAFTLSNTAITSSVPDLGTTQQVTLYISGALGEIPALQTFQFVAPAVLTSVTPASGSVVGGNPVILYGSKFLGPGQAILRVGGIQTTFTVNAEGNQMYFDMPPHEEGGVNFSVENMGIVTTTSVFGYTYIADPSIAQTFLPSPGNHNESKINVE